MFKKIASAFKTTPLVLALVLSFGLSYAYASWAEPTSVPPSGNVDAPINVGSTAQTKTGGLTVDTLGLPAGGTINANGSNSTYGAFTAKGSKNGWSGINFKDAAGANVGTLMMHPSYSGFFNAADNGWRMYVAETGVAGQMGNVYANDYYIAAAGTWASSLNSSLSGSYGGQYRWSGTSNYCAAGNPLAGNACSCPGGFRTVYMGLNDTRGWAGWVLEYICVK